MIDAGMIGLVLFVLIAKYIESGPSGLTPVLKKNNE
jgi:hypothetical protein